MTNIVGYQQMLMGIESVVCDEEIYLIFKGNLKSFNKNLNEELVGVSIYGSEEGYAIDAIEILSETYTDYVFYFNPPVSEGTGYGSYQKLLVDLASGSSTYDIYYVINAPIRGENRSNINWDTMKKQGYMMDLNSSEKLVEYTDMMFPWLRESCYYDGKLIMIPLYSNIQGVLSKDKYFDEVTWEDIVQKELSSLKTDFFTALPFEVERFEDLLLGQYMLNFRDKSGHVNFLSDEFSTLLDFIDRTNEPNFILENSRYENIGSSYELKIEDLYGVFYNSDDDRFPGQVYPIPGYENKQNTKVPVPLRYICINPNSEHKEAALELLEQIAYQAYEETVPLFILFENLEKYLDLAKSPRQEEIMRQAYMNMENGSTYVDTQFIAYAVSELFPKYKESAMDKEEFIKYFIEKYEMWYEEQQ